jgi:peptidyl-prolyl cis-trans isomerase SurA
MMTFGTFRKAAALTAAVFIPMAAAAPAGSQPPTGQRATNEPAPDAPLLNLPQEISFLGRAQDANVARATALVNDEIITRSDVEQRVALFLASQRIQLPADELERLRAQVLRNLIDEALQIQAARENEITIDEAQVASFYSRFASNFGHTAQTFSDYLRSIGSSERSVKRQILGELAWQQLQRRITSVSVNDAEVEQVLARLLAARGSDEYHVAEIYLQATPENAAQVRSNLAQIIEQIRRGASFAAYARQYSQATTAAVGGDLGWVQAAQLPPELAAVVRSIPVQAISDPVQVPGGFSVVALVDKRQILVADPRDAVLSLMQMSINFPPGTPEPTVQQRAAQLANATQSMGGCGRAPEVATSLGAELVSNDTQRVRELPPQLQQILLGMSVGQATQVIGSRERISVLVLCGRDDPEAAPTPTSNLIAQQMEEERMNRQAQRYLRDLRRDAVIEYR